jgi:hypothetical protein
VLDVVDRDLHGSNLVTPARDQVMVAVDSKENFDAHCSGNWYHSFT